MRINAAFVRLQLKADDYPLFERIVDERIAIALVAVQSIAPGDEIYVSYGDDTWVRYLEEMQSVVEINL